MVRVQPGEFQCAAARQHLARSRFILSGQRVHAAAGCQKDASRQRNEPGHEGSLSPLVRLRAPPISPRSAVPPNALGARLSPIRRDAVRSARPLRPLPLGGRGRRAMGLNRCEQPGQAIRLRIHSAVKAAKRRPRRRHCSSVSTKRSGWPHGSCLPDWWLPKPPRRFASSGPSATALPASSGPAARCRAKRGLMKRAQ